MIRQTGKTSDTKHKFICFYCITKENQPIKEQHIHTANQKLLKLLKKCEWREQKLYLLCA